ncbi:AIM24 family protein [Methanosarcina sp. Z-7115]|uniref:AIM24 family protein n=1 Tax=Methanosarcina baikalica TaxID=3073890 RepID=A0ABU2D523_9EURY|nr:AIM24 family protein [Methanosarcina sp. Z-7115]MDR7667084.1 AIM24 family protein [Methanosarcina sp. Z-7115]
MISIAWSGNIEPEIKKDISLKTLVGRGSGESLQMAFRGEGFVLIQPYEEVYFHTQA